MDKKVLRNWQLLAGLLVVVLVGTVLFNVLGHRRGEDRIDLHTGESDFRQAGHLVTTSVLQFIPVGSDVMSAKRVMEVNDFGCSIETNSEYGSYDGDDDAITVYRHASFLYCGTESPLRHYQVVIAFNKSNKITGISTTVTAE